MTNRLVKAASEAAAAYQEAGKPFDRRKEEALGGLPWLIGVVTDIVTGLQERFPKARLGRLFWDDNHFHEGEQPGCWLLEISYPRYQLRTIKAGALDDYCTSMTVKYGLGITVIGRSRGRK